MRKLLAAVPALVLLAGCPSFSTMGLGFAIKLGDTFWILPEVSMSYPVATTHGMEATTDLAFQGVIIQGQLGLLFGG